ncbi:gallidermin/nisin family lantibiotic [Thermostaphylospora chromogena]|uniref:Lantibiotic, gallidermin/nisin family n=1 Tax=Thermostaphylospora chromogena TaxID=35622 RepID=A0A1H1H880_9ACTN|nr:gallidermin/nisin family lantibiotic [Thermostaphylospora chromogena]SDR21705.1 lantibiotic, gallidermin/nisin family [Thermostaphylospora chromogena]
MSDFDLDPEVDRHPQTPTPESPQITSVSLCTPGCQTGFLACFSQACNPTGGCKISK